MFFEDAQQAKLDQHVADELRISVEALEGHTYEIEEHASDDGVLYGWRVLWHDEPPEGVKGKWQNIGILHEPDGPED